MASSTKLTLHEKARNSMPRAAHEMYPPIARKSAVYNICIISVCKTIKSEMKGTSISSEVSTCRDTCSESRARSSQTTESRG